MLSITEKEDSVSSLKCREARLWSRLTQPPEVSSICGLPGPLFIARWSGKDSINWTAKLSCYSPWRHTLLPDTVHAGQTSSAAYKLQEHWHLRNQWLTCGKHACYNEESMSYKSDWPDENNFSEHGTHHLEMIKTRKNPENMCDTYVKLLTTE